jgi:hypothetical protein
MRVACVVFFATSLSVSPTFPLGLDGEDGQGAMGVHYTQPPALMEQVFTYYGSPNRYGLDPFYALHVSAWCDSPHGTFVYFNPDVSCDGFVRTS